MSPLAFCRLRQTCRKVEEFTERHRFSSKTYCLRSKYMLIISVGEENKIGFDFEILPYENTISSSVKKYRELQKANSLPHGIIDPYNQLSGIMFNLILVNYSSSSKFFHSYAFKKFLSQMQELQLECSFLCFYDYKNKYRNEQNLIFQSLIKYQNIANLTSVLSSEYRIKHAKRESLGYFLDLPSNLGSMIRHLEYAWLGKAFENNHRFVSILEDFLEELCINKEARGSLIELTVETDQYDKLMKPEQLVEIYSGGAYKHGKKKAMTLQKLSIGDGAAIIAHFAEYGGIFDVYFLTSYNRKELYHLLSKEMFPDVIRDAFFAAADDISAMKVLNPPPS